MSISAKNFEAIADAIRDARETIKYPDLRAEDEEFRVYHAAQGAVLLVAQEMADRFEVQNERFNRARFMHRAFVSHCNDPTCKNHARMG